MGEIKSFGGLPKTVDARADMLDPDEELLPCGHSKRQSVLLGCTETECRPGDVKISTLYFAEKLAAARKGR